MTLPPHTSRLAIGIAVLAGIDLASKRWAVGELADGPIALPGPVDLQLHYNSGTAFGMFTNIPTLVISATTIVIAIVVVNMWRTTDRGPVSGQSLTTSLARLTSSQMLSEPRQFEQIIVTAWVATSMSGHAESIARRRRDERSSYQTATASPAALHPTWVTIGNPRR